MPTGLGFTDALLPCYRRVSEGGVSFGLLVSDAHTNTMGICHGGVLLTLADITGGSGVNFASGKKAGSPTINLNIDFISAARRGEWIQGDAESVTLKRRFGFCSGAISNSKGVVARFHGTFYLPDHQGMWKQEGGRDGLLTASED